MNEGARVRSPAEREEPEAEPEPEALPRISRHDRARAFARMYVLGFGLMALAFGVFLLVRAF